MILVWLWVFPFLEGLGNVVGADDADVGYRREGGAGVVVTLNEVKGAISNMAPFASLRVTRSV